MTQAFDLLDDTAISPGRMSHRRREASSRIGHSRSTVCLSLFMRCSAIAKIVIFDWSQTDSVGRRLKASLHIRQPGES